MRAPLPVVRRALVDPYLLDALVRRCRNPDARAYFTSEFGSLPASVTAGVVTRHTRLLRSPRTRLALTAGATVRWGDILEHRGLTVIRTDRAALGEEHEVAFWNRTVWTGLERAIMSRHVGPATRRVLLIADEAPAWFTRRAAAGVELLLSRARARRVGLVIAHQTPQQLDAASPVLAAAVRTNVSYAVVFRQAPQDAAAFRMLLPVGPPLDRDEVVRWLAKVPNRWALLVDRRQGTSSFIATPTVPDLPEVGDEALAQRLERGRHGVGLAELRFRAEALETRLGALRDEGRAALAGVEPVRGRRGRRAAPAPVPISDDGEVVLG